MVLSLEFLSAQADSRFKALFLSISPFVLKHSNLSNPKGIAPSLFLRSALLWYIIKSEPFIQPKKEGHIHLISYWFVYQHRKSIRGPLSIQRGSGKWDLYPFWWSRGMLEAGGGAHWHSQLIFSLSTSECLRLLEAADRKVTPRCSLRKMILEPDFLFLFFEYSRPDGADGEWSLPSILGPPCKRIKAQ